MMKGVGRSDGIHFVRSNSECAWYVPRFRLSASPDLLDTNLRMAHVDFIFTSHNIKHTSRPLQSNTTENQINNNKTISMRLSLARRLHSKLGAPAAATRAAIASSNYSTLPSQNRGSDTTPAQQHNINITSLPSSRKYTTYSQLPSEHQMVYEMCRKFAEEELMPNAGNGIRSMSFLLRR